MLKKFLLQKKINKSSEVVKKALEDFSQGSIALAWTGGKDSTLLLWIVKKVCEESNLPLPRLLFINEGDIFPEIEEFVKKVTKEWSLNVTEVKNEDVLKQAKKLGDKIIVKKLNERNKEELTRLGFTNDFFNFEPESMIGNHLMKTVPMNEYIENNSIKALITGIRKDEQEARSQETYFSKRDNPPHVRVHPILDFSEKDVWAAIHAYKIPYVSLYEKGYRSLGAKSSTGKVSDIPAWEQDLKNTTERAGRRQDKEKIMEKLRKLGYM